MFTVSFPVRLHHTDAAAVMFFGDYFRVAHDAYEDFMAEIGFPIGALISDSPWLPLIVHSEADYTMPLRAGEDIWVDISVRKIGQSSFTLEYEIRNSKGEESAQVKTVHVSVDSLSHKKLPLPDDFVKSLKAHLISLG